jgi:ParB family transcriptional regulator, chromosome partitioning protein
MLTENTVRASDRRVQFIGLDAYEQAGGAIMRDLFERDDGGWLQDVPLLDRLVTEKLKVQAETIAAEGWKWIAVAVNFPYRHTGDLRELDGVPAELTDEERATIDALKTESDQIEANYQDAEELPDEVDQRLGQIEAALAAFEARRMIYDPADVARAGVFVSIDDEGGAIGRSRLCPPGRRSACRRRCGSGIHRWRRRSRWGEGEGLNPPRGHYCRRRSRRAGR